MSKVGINFSIDVTKLDKSKFIQGKKGTYANMVAFVNLDEKDQYDNNGMITQQVSKEEREQGVQGAILGNVRVFWSDTKNGNNNTQYGNQQSNEPSKTANYDPDSADAEYYDDRIPF